MRVEISGKGRGGAYLTMLILVIVLAKSAGASEASLLGEDAAGILTLGGETKLWIEGLRGKVSVRVGKPGEFRFLSTMEEGRKEPLAVALWREDRGLRIRALPGAEETARSLEVSVPPDFDLDIRLSHSKVTTSGLVGRVEIHGKELNVTTRALGGSVVLNLEGGTASVHGVGEELSLRGRDLDARLNGVSGDLFASLVGGQLEIRESSGDVDLDLDGSRLSVRGIVGSFRLRGSRGEAEIHGLAQGGDLKVAGTPLRLSRCSGVLDIETDAPVSLDSSKASLHVNGYGASVKSTDHTGLIEVKTDNAEIELEKISGPVRIQGDGLAVRVEQIEGELLVLASSSNIVIDGATARVTLENQFGDIAVQNATDEVSVVSRNGTVRLTQLGGPINVEANGERVEVVWKTLNQTADSFIHNEGGDVFVGFPGQGGCKVEAFSRFGRIETDLPDLEVSSDGNRASGILNARSRPTVRVESEGSIELVSRSTPEASRRPPTERSGSAEDLQAPRARR